MGEAVGHVKDYGHDPNKRELRRHFLDFITDALWKQDYSKTSVLCLAGGELWEWNETYSHLKGIDPRNVSIVERDPLLSRLIKASLPEAEVYAGELLQYVATTDRKFDIISLDFCTNFSRHIMDIMEVIRARELLKDNGVMMLAVSARRENKDAKQLMTELLELATLEDTPDLAVERLIGGYSIADSVMEENLAKMRSDCITHGISTTLLGGPDSVYIDWVDQNGNDTLRRRIEQLSFRKFAEISLRKHELLEKNKIKNARMEDDGKITADVVCTSERQIVKFGVVVKLPDMTNDDLFKKMLWVIHNGKIVLCGEDQWISRLKEIAAFNASLDDMSVNELLVDVARDEILVKQAGWESWHKAFWEHIAAAKEGSRSWNARVAISLFKNSLLRLFEDDLKRVVIRAEGLSIELKPPRNVGGMMFEYTMSGKAGVYWLTDMKRFRYVSDTRCPMMVDFYRVSRNFVYDQVVEVSPEGKIIPFVPRSALKSGDARKIEKAIAENLLGYNQWMNTIAKALRANANDHYPERVVIDVGDDMKRHESCENCTRLEKELDLLKAQLREMREIVASKKKVVKRAMTLGTYDRIKIAEMDQTGADPETIAKELRVTKGQVNAVRAWITMEGGPENYLRKQYAIAESEQDKGNGKKESEKKEKEKETA